MFFTEKHINQLSIYNKPPFGLYLFYDIHYSKLVHNKVNLFLLIHVKFLDFQQINVTAQIFSTGNLF